MPPQTTDSWQRVDSRGYPVGVDRENQVIRGYIVAQEGPFKNLGRGEFDKKSLQQIRQLMKAAPNGLKSHFAHPDLSADGIGKYLGRARDPRYDTISSRESYGELKTDEIRVIRADLHLDPTSRNTPSGDLGGYVMELAESDSDALSSSLVVQKTEEYRLDKDGRPKRDDAGNELPPLWRLTKVHASDIVDQGDAVDGFLSVDALPDSALHRGGEILDRLFEGQSHDEIKDLLTAYLGRYLARRFGEDDDAGFKGDSTSAYGGISGLITECGAATATDNPPHDEGRRLARVLVSPDLLVNRQGGVYHVLEHGRPADARVVGTRYVAESNQIELMLESAEFGPIPPGGAIPIRRAPLIERVDEEPPEPPPEPPPVYDPSRDPELRRRRRRRG